ncbi:hypothetical protein [Paenibacillus taichungensis]
MNHVTQKEDGPAAAQTLNLKNENEEPILIEETTYYKRLAGQITDLEHKIPLKIDEGDLPFWKSMFAERVKCAKEWMMLSDDHELHEADLSIFTELLNDVTSNLVMSIWKRRYSISISLYKMHAVIGALEIQSHDAMYVGNQKDYLLACKYTKTLQELTQPYQATFHRIDEILHGRSKV